MSRPRHTYRPGDYPVPGYRLIESLGRGNFGEAWLTSAPGGMEVALKIIDLSGREGAKEFEALQRVKHIRHPNLVPLVASWLLTEDGQVLDDLSDAATSHLLKKHTARRPAAAQDPGDGNLPRLVELIIAMGLGSRSLAARLEECLNAGLSGIPHEELLEYMEGAARGIDYLNQPIHDLGEGLVSIIHGDIKPHNILIVGNAVQVADFGLVRAIQTLRKTSTGMGTFAYAAPELLEGKASRMSDQYCLAVTYVELCTGELPFSETNPLKVVELHRRGDLDLSTLQVREREVIRRATAVDPDLRWPSCSVMVRALRQACDADAGNSTLSAPAPPASLAGTLVVPTADVPTVREVVPEVVTESVAAGDTGPVGRPPQSKRHPARAAMVLAITGLAAVAPYFLWSGLHPGFQWIVPSAVSLAAGEETTVAIDIVRASFTGTVEPVFEQVPSGVTIDAGPILPGQSNGKARIAADLNASPATTEITLRGVGMPSARTATVVLTIQPVKPWLPPGTVEAPGALRVKEGRNVCADRILCTRHGVSIPLILIRKMRPDDPPTFYVMEDKVWNGLFAQFARARPEAMAHSQWQLGGIKQGIQGGKLRAGVAVTAAQERLPVLRVTCEEACQFADWLGGRLPTVEQWDKAAGRYDNREGSGPFREPWDPEDPRQIAVGRAQRGPMEVGTATHDISQPFGCRDMAGNGREWTRTAKQAEVTLPLKHRDEFVTVVLRGRSYASPKPLSYKDLADPLEQGAEWYTATDPYTGFRVVFDQLPP